MARLALTILLVYAVFVFTPFPFYAGAAALTGLEPPAPESPGLFFLSVLVQKLGHSTVFVLLFHCARGAFHNRWLVYAALWWLFFAIDETGSAIGPEYTWVEAGAGVLAEAVYFPVGAYIAHRLLAPRRAEPASDA